MMEVICRRISVTFDISVGMLQNADLYIASTNPTSPVASTTDAAQPLAGASDTSQRWWIMVYRAGTQPLVFTPLAQCAP